MLKKIGDIYRNNYSGYIDTKYFIYIGMQGELAKGLEYVKGRGWRKCLYNLNNKLIDGTPAFKKIAHSDFMQVAKKDLELIKECDK
ncbi:MAG TPA: hypothetical protein IAB27_05345 [Candidatus Coprosoma intestinipullorum]|uniref:Uncharacterized protein n=1 Tax=Candidatus Coprosoma intestinipullorum TaxID=2840752 RepID=A0A9D0ZR80_9FIRM|nr:hypothetical protein [Candidatus Coprosoma intestinipullorum]